MRGRRLNRLTTRPSFKTLNDYIIKNMFLQLFFGGNSEFFCKNIDFSKEDIRLCRKTKKVNPLLAGGCAALPHQSFRFSTDLAYRKRLALPYILCGLRIVRIPYTAGVDLIISEYVQKCNREKEKNRDEICRAAVSSLRYWKKMKNQAEFSVMNGFSARNGQRGELFFEQYGKIFQEGQKLFFVIEPVSAVFDFAFRARDGAVTEIGRDAQGVFEGDSVCDTAAERRSEHVARTVKIAVDLFERDPLFALIVIIEIISVLVVRARDDGMRAERGERFERGRKIAFARQKIALRLVGQNVVRFAAERDHLLRELSVESLIKREVIAEDGIDDEYAVFFEEAAFDVFDELDLTAASEVSAANKVELKAERFPMRADLFHFRGKIEEGVSRESARMRGEQGGGQDVAGRAARRDHGHGDGQRAFSDAGNIVDGKNAHKASAAVFQTAILSDIIRVRAVKVNRCGGTYGQKM